MEENKNVQPSSEMPEMENKPSKGKKKGSLLKLIIALVVIGVIAAVVVLGVQGDWLQGRLFGGKVRTVAPISRTVDTVKTTEMVKNDAMIETSKDMVEKDVDTVKLDGTMQMKEIESVAVTKDVEDAMIEKEMIEKEADKLVMESIDKEVVTGELVEVADDSGDEIVLAPIEQTFSTLPGKPQVKITFLDNTGGGFVDDSIYGQQTPRSNDIVMAFEVEVIGDKGAWVEMQSLETDAIQNEGVEYGDYAYFNFGKFGDLVRLNYVDELVNNVTLIAEQVELDPNYPGSAGDDTFASSEFVNKSWTRVNAGESKVFAIMYDSSNMANMLNSYDHIGGSVVMDNIKFLDQTGELHQNVDIYFVGTPRKEIIFK